MSKSEKDQIMIGLHNKLPFATLIYSKRIDPSLKKILDNSNKSLRGEELITLCKIYQPARDWSEVQKNMDHLDRTWKDMEGWVGYQNQ